MNLHVQYCMGFYWMWDMCILSKAFVVLCILNIMIFMFNIGWVPLGKRDMCILSQGLCCFKYVHLYIGQCTYKGFGICTFHAWCISLNFYLYPSCHKLINYMIRVNFYLYASHHKLINYMIRVVY
jgi:hypothetical protein